MSRQMVQNKLHPASVTQGALPLRKLEVFRRLGVTIKPSSKPEPAEKPTVVIEPEVLIEDTPAPEPNNQEISVEEPVVDEATPEVASESVVEDTTAVKEEEVLTPISELHLRKSYVTALSTGNIETIEALADYINSGKDLAELSGIGATAANSIKEKFEAWQNEQSQTK